MKNILLLLMLLPLSMIAQDLDSLFQEAAENNPALQASYLDFEAALKKVDQVSSLPDPTFGFGYFISPVETRVGPQQAKFSLTQMFPWFGTLGAKSDLASEMAQVKYQQFIDQRNALRLDLESAYFPLFEQEQHLRLRSEDLDILRSYVALTESTYANGKGALVDIIRVEVMIEKAETDLLILEEKRKPLLQRFNAIMGRPSEAASPIMPEDLSAFVSENNMNQNIESHSKLAVLDARLSAIDAQEGLARIQGRPSFGLGVDYALVSERKDVTIPDNGKDVLMPMLSVSLPIYRKRIRASIEEAELLRNSVLAQKESVTDQLESQLAMAQFEAKSARELLQSYRKQEGSVERIIGLLQTTYSNSGVDFEELLRAEQQRLSYQIAIVTAQKELAIANSKLNYIIQKNEK